MGLGAQVVLGMFNCSPLLLRSGVLRLHCESHHKSKSLLQRALCQSAGDCRGDAHPGAQVPLPASPPVLPQVHQRPHDGPQHDGAPIRLHLQVSAGQWMCGTCAASGCVAPVQQVDVWHLCSKWMCGTSAASGCVAPLQQVDVWHLCSKSGPWREQEHDACGQPTWQPTWNK